MKLKTLLTMLYFENIVRFVLMDEEDFDVIGEFIARADSDMVKRYEEYWVTLIDMEDNTIHMVADSGQTWLPMKS